jgi:hypothetical protein
MEKFNFGAPAELYPTRNRKIRNGMRYRRFADAAEAIRFAIEELPPPLFLGAFIESDDLRLNHKEIRDLYDSALFPRKSALH